MPYKDPEAKKKYAREYREKNRDKINARLKEWRKGEGPRKKQQEYKEKNKEKHKKYWVE